MEFKDITKSSTFVAVIFALVVVLLPFGIEQIGEATGLYSFSVTKTIKGWFGGSASVRAATAAKPVDWERYRRDLEMFTAWTEGRRGAVISLPKKEMEVITLPPPEKSQRHLWHVSVTSCSSGNPLSGKKGYVFMSGFDRRFSEGELIAPCDDRCGYEIAFVGERAVWFRAVFDDEDDTPMGRVKFPEPKRVEDGCIVIGNRRYVARDAFLLESGGWLTIDDFLSPDGVLFKLRDERRREVASILCIVIGEKGGR